MKVSISRHDVDKIVKRYSEIQKNAEYAKDYSEYQGCERKMFGIFDHGNKQKVDEGFKAMQRKAYLENKWGMKFLIKPSYKISFKKSYKSIRPGTSLAKLVYALGVLNEPDLVKEIKAKKVVSDQRLIMDARIRKFFCFSIIKGTKISYAALGRVMHVDKNTIKRWVEEVDSWTPAEQENARIEMQTSKNQSILKDALDLNRRMLDISEIHERFSGSPPL